LVNNLPLAGYRVVDFGWVWAGTLLGSILGLYGAEVIKMESKRRIDGLRIGKVFELGNELEKNTFFQNLNRNKLSITLDISKPKGVQLIKELVKKSDIVSENFSPGVLERRGMDYPSLAKVKPDIIMVSLSPMGQQGPLSRLVTYAPIISALSGIDSLVGYPDENPIGFKHAYADVVASMCGLFSVLAAIRHHARTGEGQYIDLSQCESVMPAMGEAFMDYEMNGRVMRPQGNTSKTIAPHGIYPCSGDDKWVSIAVKTEEEWQSFCQAIGNPSWATQDKFSDASRRIANAKELDKHVTEWTLQHDRYEVAEILQKAGVAATPVLTTEDIFLDPHFNERKTFVDVEHPMTGSSVLYNTPWKIKDMEVTWHHAPLLGEYNDYVFEQILGLSREEVDRLMEEEVIY
jgi:benzylsuccinate CoA-transferase BbsF subunit